jgi:hypothetical protein
MAQLYWYCPFCHTANHPASVFCGSCGNPSPKPSLLSKVTPGLLVAGGVLLAAGMIFGALAVGVSRSRTPEVRALQVSPQSTIPAVPYPSITPMATPVMKRRTPASTPPATTVEAVDPDLSYTAPNESRSDGATRYITGPRGGCYYVNSSGNKTYVDRSRCGSETPSQPLYSAPSKSSSSEYTRGPRGGCYYINSRGNKTYVDRSLCD